ncbi:MAG: ABC transporter permease [Haloarculaceae archaeon]
MAFSELLTDPRAVIARRELSSLSREKTIVLALLIQLFVAAFSSFLVVGLTSMYDPQSVASGGVQVGVTGEAADSVQQAATEVDGVALRTYPDNASATAAFRNGRVDVVLVAQRLPDTRVGVTATVPEGSLRTTLLVVQVRRLLDVLERQQRVARAPHLDAPVVPMPPSVPASPYFGFTYTILVPLLLFLPPFISGSVAVDAVTEEIERGTMELLRVAPVTLGDIVDGKAAAMIVLAPLQAVLWIALLAFNGISVAHVPLLVLTVTAMAVTVVAVGVGLGLAVGERRTAQLIYSVGVLALFGAAVLLPEHPATTVAKLAIDSPTATTYGLVALYAVLAVGLYAAVRRYVGGVDAESL